MAGECPIISGCSGPGRVPGTRGSLLWRALQQQGVVEGGGGQGPHQPQLLVADAVELGRVHAVYGQGADQRLIREQRQADAGVHLEVVVIRQQAVIGVGQGAVGREAHHIPGAGDGLEARVILEGEAATQHVLHQAVDGQRDELAPLVAQQGRGIRFQQAAHALDQAVEAVLMGDAELQVEGDARQAVGRDHDDCPNDSVFVILTIKVWCLNDNE